MPIHLAGPKPDSGSRGSLYPPYFSSTAQNATIFFLEEFLWLLLLWQHIRVAVTEIKSPSETQSMWLGIQRQVHLWVPAFYVLLAIALAYTGVTLTAKTGVKPPFDQPPTPPGPHDPGQVIAAYIDNLPSTGHAKLDLPATMEKGETNFATLYVGGLRLPMKKFLEKNGLAGEEDVVHIKILSTMRATLQAAGFTILNTEPKTAQTVPDSGTVIWTWTIRADTEGRLPVSATLIAIIPPRFCELYENKDDCPKEHVLGIIPPKTITVTYGLWHKTIDLGWYVVQYLIHPNARFIWLLLLAVFTTKKVWDRVSPFLRQS